uniref:SRCR domain-containing protein n=1 Tax=Ascaris lumbricoides TaxID=6252 RepID=A0A0M3IM39_ASCLU
MKITISKNSFKFNTGQSIVSIGLNEDASNQMLLFNQQNEVRENTVINPFPYLNPRSSPYAALIVSSSNVEIRRNCFKNPRASFEIATELSQHAKWIDARENNWGHPFPGTFMHRIFDQFNRYSLASIEVNPFAAVCNQRNPHITTVQQYYRSFRKEGEPYVLGGTIWENEDLDTGRYTIMDDLNIVPGARLTISPGTVFEFSNGVGMLVQGEMIRADFQRASEPVTFTSRPFQLPKLAQIRLVDENDNQEVTAGRLEVFVDGQWGTICNRSWSEQLARLACNQLGLIMDSEHFENWRIFPSAGSLPMVMDNIRCEEREYDLTQCRHDGVTHNLASSCASTEVVGIRCAEPRWAGVRYSLLANPPAITGQTSMDNWIIERAGLFDFRISAFSAALQIDWNYHSFQQLTIRDNFWNGIDVIYNDLTKKPAIRNSRFENNRRHGFKIRSPGMTIEDVIVNDNGNAGFRYNPRVSVSLQRDIVTWLERREQPEMEANNVYTIPNRNITTISVHESQLNQRKFLLARATSDCPLALLDPCVYELSLKASGFEYGLSARIAIQIVNRVGQRSDEDILIVDKNGNEEWSVRKDAIQFPIVSSSSNLEMRYTRTYGNPEVVLLVLFLDAQEYLDRFVHVYRSVIQTNQYGLSSMHYSDFNFADGTILNRWSVEKLWFQKVNFTANTEAVIWVHSPQHVLNDGTPIAQIGYHIDNCSVVNNTGSLIETHRDLYSSANVFHWNLWSNTFDNNENTIGYHIDNCSVVNNTGSLIETHRDLYSSANVFHWNLWSNTFDNNENTVISVHLPDTYNLLSPITHSFLITENRFENNNNFGICIDGYYAFVNISSNNFTNNNARQQSGIVEIRGMEKHFIFERNRIIDNWGMWALKVDIQSQSLRGTVPSLIQYNYLLKNRFISTTGDYVDSWPRSFAVGIFGAQLAEIHFNRFKNVLIDFELVSGCKSSEVSNQMNVTFNWWGIGNEAQILQRIFDFDDWNIYTLAEFSPFYVTEEHFINFWWTPQKVHIWPNVRILVLGHLIAEGTFWEPIRFKPINITEYEEIQGQVPTRYRRSSITKFWRRHWKSLMRFQRALRAKRRADWNAKDIVYQQFPSLRRQDPFYQRFTVRLNGSNPRWGFLEMYNATTGEYIPSCDREFTMRNAQVFILTLIFVSV